MEPSGISCVFVAASANTLNPLHTTDDEGSHPVTESSFGAPSEKGRVVLTNTRALQGEQTTTAALCCGGDSMPDGSESPSCPADASETLQSRSSRILGGTSTTTFEARPAQAELHAEHSSTSSYSRGDSMPDVGACKQR